MNLKDMSRGQAQKTADLSAKKVISYYVAECMEFSNLGEYHDNLTADQAVEIYERIPPERRNAIKGIGITIHI